LAKAWLHRAENILKDKEERIKEKEVNYNTLQSEISALKSELAEIKSNPDYWIKNREERYTVSNINVQ